MGLGSLLGFSAFNPRLSLSAKPIHHHGEACLKLKVTVAGKGSEYCLETPSVPPMPATPPPFWLTASVPSSAFPELSHGQAVAPCQPRGVGACGLAGKVLAAGGGAWGGG